MTKKNGMMNCAINKNTSMSLNIHTLLLIRFFFRTRNELLSFFSKLLERCVNSSFSTDFLGFSHSGLLFM